MSLPGMFVAAIGTVAVRLLDDGLPDDLGLVVSLFAASMAASLVYLGAAVAAYGGFALFRALHLEQPAHVALYLAWLPASLAIAIGLVALMFAQQGDLVDLSLMAIGSVATVLGPGVSVAVLVGSLVIVLIAFLARWTRQDHEVSATSSRQPTARRGPRGARSGGTMPARPSRKAGQRRAHRKVRPDPTASDGHALDDRTSDRGHVLTTQCATPVGAAPRVPRHPGNGRT
jgi:hypothetical protein